MEKTIIDATEFEGLKVVKWAQAATHYLPDRQFHHLSRHGQFVQVRENSCKEEVCEQILNRKPLRVMKFNKNTFPK